MKNPENQTIELPGLKGSIKRVYILGEGIKCKVSKTSQGIRVQLPSSFDVSEEFKVIVLEFAGGFSVSPMNILKLDKQNVSLDHENSFKYFSNSGIDYATRYTSTIKEVWTVQASADALYTPELFYSEEERGKAIDLTFNGATQTVHLNDGDKVSLPNNVSSVCGPLYLQGPLWSGLEGVHGVTKEIDVNKPWAESVERPWQAMPDWKNGITYTLPADIENAYYVLQEIESNEDKKTLVKITSGDALVVWLNGKQKYIQINQLKRDSVTHFVELDLKRGKNQLLVKLFNKFHKQIPFAIDFSVPQVIYRKELPTFNFKKNKLYSVDWKLRNPDTPHQDMNLPNAKVILRKTVR
jgi:alpha-L-fucosidase